MIQRSACSEEDTFVVDPFDHSSKHPSSAQGIQIYNAQDDPYDSPNKARIVEKSSIASTSSYQLGGEAQRGVLKRQSLEDNCLSADGEEMLNTFCAVPVFTRAAPTAHSCSSTCTSSCGGDTLSSSDGSSISGGSQSSIDFFQIGFALSNAMHPMPSVERNRACARARGTGHDGGTQNFISRSSV